MKVKVLMRPGAGIHTGNNISVCEVVCTRFELRELELDTLNKRNTTTVVSFYKDDKEIAWYKMYDIIGMEFDHDYKG